MRKVKNQKVIRNLSDKSFRASRTRNTIAVLAIALTSMLFTTLFTIGLGSVENFQQQTMRQSGGDSHGVIKDITMEEYEALKDHPLIKESAACEVLADNVANPEFLKRHVELWYVPEYHYPHRYLEIEEGRAPEKADEVLVDEVTMELLRLPKETGQEITLSLQVGMADPAAEDRTFTVTGILKADPAMNTGFVVTSEDYLTKYAEEIKAAEREEYAMTGRIDMDVNFSNSFNIQKKLEQVITESGYSVTEGDKNYLSSNVNWAYVSDSAQSDPMTMGAVAGGLFIILLTGYLIIYNVFQISVVKDIRYYGLLKTIGTTGRQIRKIVRRQAWKLAVAGIPLGLVTGFFVGKGIVPLVVERSAYQGSDVQVSLNPWIFAGAILFSLATVWISTRKPARIAGRVSPIEAVRYTEDQNEKKKEKKGTDGGKLWRMALSNLARSKGRTVIVILSLSLSVILLNSIFTVTSSFSMDQFLKKFVVSDFLIANAEYFNSEYYGVKEGIEEISLSESFIRACEEEDGFERGGRLYMSNEVGLEAETYQPTENVMTDENGEFYNMFGSEKVPYQRNEDGSYRTTFYGLEDYPLEKAEPFEGETDLSVIKEKLATGKYLLGAVATDDNDQVIEDEIYYHAGDHVTLVMKDGEKREFEILSLIKENYYGLTNRMGSQFAFYTTADVFLSMESPDYLMSYEFDVEDGREAQFEEFLENYTTTQEPLMHYESKQKWLDEFNGLTGLFTLVGGVLTMVVGVIGILNFVNATLTGIVTRKREFAIMEAIGMTKRQLTRMLMLEGLYYAGFTILCSLAGGCLLSVTLVRILADGMWFMEYQFILWPMLIVFPILLLLGVLVPYLAYLPQRRESVVSVISRESA
ncbi:FtsX-like permease family protein [Merdimonas faecis]|uniref:ABC transporter permease n=1 Tax=Merdimonas faecis TaxID=1653435 RepID=UPI0032099265